MVLFLNNEEVEDVLNIRDCMDAIEDAYKDLAEGQAVNVGGRS